MPPTTEGQMKLPKLIEGKWARKAGGNSRMN